MGIYICMAVSKAVTQAEWENAYRETVTLVEKLPLAELRTLEIHGNPISCLVPSKERACISEWEETKGWKACGDLDTLGIAETYALYENLEIDSVNPEAGDAILGVVSNYIKEDTKDPKFHQTYYLWGMKTQGEYYHMYLLAIAALLEARLKEKIFVYGDITKGQYKAAVEIANQYLKEPIGLPDSCDMERFCERVGKLPLSDAAKIDVIEEFYLGPKDNTYGECLRKYFKNELRNYWTEIFTQCELGTSGFQRQFQKYINWGFALEELFHLIDVQNKSKEEICEKLVGTILDSGLCTLEKDLRDPLSINAEEEQPYGVATLFAQGIFGAARNKKVAEYMPLEKVQEILERNFGQEINVAAYIETHLKKEKPSDVSEEFSDYFYHEKEELEKEHEEYDIADTEDLLYYQKGNSILPSIQKGLKKSMNFLESILEEERYQDLLQKDADTQFHWLVMQKRHYCIQKEDWERIYERLATSKGLARYYALFRIQLGQESVRNMATALLVNDELWDFCKNYQEKHYNDEE